MVREIKFRAWDGKVIVDLNRIEQHLDVTTKYQQYEDEKCVN